MTSDAIDQMFSFTLNGMAFAVEIVGKVTPEILHFFSKLKHEGLTKEGEIALQNLFLRDDGIEAVNIREQDLETFQNAAHSSNLLYAVASLDTVNKEGERVMTVYFSPKFTPAVNQIIEVNHLDVVQAGSAKVSNRELDMEVPLPGDADIPPEQEPPVQEQDWLQFFGPEGEYGTPEENKVRREELENLTPTQPASETESPSRTSSGQQKEPGTDSPAPEREPLTAYRGTADGIPKTVGESTVGADERTPLEEQVTEAKRALNNTKTPEAGRDIAEKVENLIQK